MKTYTITDTDTPGATNARVTPARSDDEAVGYAYGALKSIVRAIASGDAVGPEIARNIAEDALAFLEPVMHPQADIDAAAKLR